MLKLSNFIRITIIETWKQFNLSKISNLNILLEIRVIGLLGTEKEQTTIGTKDWQDLVEIQCDLAHANKNIKLILEIHYKSYIYEMTALANVVKIKIHKWGENIIMPNDSPKQL